MRSSQITTYLGAIVSLVDVIGWQKWFGAAVLGFAFTLNSVPTLVPLEFQGLIIGIPLILCYNQAVNDCFDVEIDEIKKKVMGKELVVSNKISEKAARIVTFSILLVGLLSAGLTSASLLMVASAMALLGTLYSVPPFRLKMRYPFSTVIQFIGCFLPFIAGVAITSALTLQTAVLSSIFAVLAMIHRFAHEIKHHKVDLMTKKGTVAVRQGLKTTTALLRLSALLGVVEFLVFLALGWFDVTFVFLFVLYLAIIVAPWSWLRHLPTSFRRTLTPILPLSGYILLFVTLLLYWRIHI